MALQLTDEHLRIFEQIFKLESVSFFSIMEAFSLSVLNSNSVNENCATSMKQRTIHHNTIANDTSLYYSF